MRQSWRMSSHTVTKDEQLEPLSLGMADAARLIGVSRMHIYRRLIPSGELHTFMSGGRRLVAYDELRRFVSEQEAAA